MCAFKVFYKLLLDINIESHYQFWYFLELFWKITLNIKKVKKHNDSEIHPAFSTKVKRLLKSTMDTEKECLCRRKNPKL